MMIHLILHFTLPLIVALVFFGDKVKIAYLILIATMLVDLDHLLASPVFDPGRCSIGFHPLHRLPAIFIFAGLTLIPRLRLIGVGLIIHMLLDSFDCYFRLGVWNYSHL